jgi:outer membrane protein assembly factor BamA
MISKSRRGRFSSSHVAATALLAAVLLIRPVVLLGVPNMEIKGNRTISDRTIRGLMDGVSWDGGADQRVLRGVQEAYIRQGYLFASIRLQRVGADSTIVVLIDEGEAARLDRVKIIGASRFDEETIQRVLHIEEGDQFNPGRVDRGVRELLGMYDTEGYPFTQVWIDSLGIEPATSQVGLTVHIVEGDTKSLSRIRVEGLEKTKEDVAIRLSGLRPGQPYDGDSVREAYLRLSASGVFEDVAYPTIRISPQGQGVEAVIEVVESKKTNNFTAAIGYAEQEGSKDPMLSGVVQLDLLNIGGSLRDLNVFWRNDGAGRIQTELAFRQQFFLGRRMSLGVSLQQVGQDTVYTWQSLGIQSGLPVGKLWGGLVGLDFAAHGDRNTFAQGDVTNSLRFRLTGGYSYVRGQRHRGAFLELGNQYTYADKKMNYRDGSGEQSVNQLIVGANINSALELSRRFHVANRTALQNLSSQEEFVPLSEQFYIGGAATVRGYRENQFHSPRVAFSRTELLVGRSRAENGYLFADFGYFLQQTRSPSGDVAADGRLISGYGFGLRTQSKAGNIDISFAVGEEFSLQQTKIHLMLNRTF